MQRKQKTETVQIIFTKNKIEQAVKSSSASKKFMNIAVRACVINILYHRLQIEEKHFIDKSFGEIPYKTFKSKSKHPTIRQYHAWMTGFKEAFFNNYLKQFNMFLIDEATGNIEECYKFQFKYANENTYVKKNSDDLHQTAVDLLKGLLSLENFDKLNENIKVRIEFFYNDDTPEYYEPFGFGPCDNSLTNSLTKNINCRLVLGQLNTGFHNFMCNAKGKMTKINSTPSQTTAGTAVSVRSAKTTSEDSTEMIGYSLETIPKNKVVEASDETINDFGLDDDLIEPLKNIMNTSGAFTSDDEAADAIYKTCFCQLEINNKSVEVIKCTKCRNKYHVFCHGYLHKEAINQPFTCLYCSNDPNDETFNGIPSTHYTDFARVRILFCLIYLSSEIPKNIMPDDIFEKNMMYLVNLDAVKGNGTEGYIINKSTIKRIAEDTCLIISK